MHWQYGKISNMARPNDYRPVLKSMLPVRKGKYERATMDSVSQAVAGSGNSTVSDKGSYFLVEVPLDEQASVMRLLNIRFAKVQQTPEGITVRK